MVDVSYSCPAGIAILTGRVDGTEERFNGKAEMWVDTKNVMLDGNEFPLALAGRHLKASVTGDSGK